MKGVQFPQQTTVFGKPQGWKDEDCYGLPVTQTYYENSEGKPVPCLISCWEKDGQKVYLSITGTGMPPISISTESPFPENYDKEAGLAVHLGIREEQEKDRAAYLEEREAALTKVIYESVGAASACWENIASAGKFNDQQASIIAGALISFVKNILA